MRNYLLQLLIAIDQLFNTILAGWADETLSSRSYRSAKLKESPKIRWILMYYLVNALFLNKDHCKDSYISEKNRSQLPISFRDRG